MNKKELRNLYIQRRKNLEPTEAESLSLNILDQFKSLDFCNIKYLHIFYPIIGKFEFNSLLIVDWLRNRFPEIKILLPKANLDDNTLTNILWELDNPLAVNRWGITEPENGQEISYDQIDMVIVPLLAFDKLGNRLGYGKGFYDKFLSGCRPNIEKIGISLFDPEEQFEEIDAFDVPLSKCITPNQVWEFNPYR